MDKIFEISMSKSEIDYFFAVLGLETQEQRDKFKYLVFKNESPKTIEDYYLGRISDNSEPTYRGN